MDEEVDFLLLGPFNDLLEKAQAAVETAKEDDNAEMLKAAQGLVKEGERALKNIEPIARRQYTRYGVNFVAALRDHDAIAEHIDALNELIYGFDDYTEPDAFDAEKFDELGKQARHAALPISSILKRMKLEAPSEPLSVPATPSLAPASPVLGSPVTQVDTSGSSGYHVANSPRPDGAEPVHDTSVTTQHVTTSMQRSTTVVHVGNEPSQQRQQGETPPAMGIVGGPDLGYNGGLQQDPSLPSRPGSRRSVASTVPPSPVPETPPPEPHMNPWQLGARPVIDTIPESSEAEDGTADTDGSWINGLNETGIENEDGEVERRRRVSTRPDSPTLPTDGEVSENQNPEHLLLLPPPPSGSGHSYSDSQTSPSGIRRLDEGVDAWQQRVASETRGAPGSANTSPRTVSGRPASTAWESHSPIPPVSSSWSVPVYSSSPGHTPISPRQSQNSTTTTSTVASETTNNSVFSNEHSGQGRESALEPLSPLVSAPITNPVSPGCEPAPILSGTFASARMPHPAHPLSLRDAQPEQGHPQPSPQLSAEREQPGLEAVEQVIDIDSGLIPVETTDEPVQEVAIVHRPADLAIGPNSSFHLLKGFCEGAREIQRGGSGVRQVKKLSYSGAGTYAAKCTHCLYELQWSEVQLDRGNLPSVNYRMHGIGFRLRFLSKSHLPAKQVDSPSYACLFCLHEGHTIEESDATVFFSQGQLFSHLSRHPRPLPQVPGITVIDGPERSPELQNDYDLHFILPPEPSELEGIRRELTQLPTGTAVETFRKWHGTLRRPYDNAIPLQFPAGARIVGIEFPAKYKGEWGVGWYDNLRGPFPAEAVRLDSPRKTDVRTHGTSKMRATVRWKWANGSAYRNSEWLRLDKNETITNIIYTHVDHWCWAGTNSRGRWGYFPQSHIEPNTLRETSASDKISISSHERIPSSGGRSGGLLSRFRNHSSTNHGDSGGHQLHRPASMASTSTSSSH